MQVGLDSKAVLEAWNAIHKKHADMPVVIITADAGKAFFGQSQTAPLSNNNENSCSKNSCEELYC